MTKAEILKWMLFVGNEPIEWMKLLHKHPDSGYEAGGWNEVQFKKYQKFEGKFEKWQTDGFVEHSEEELKVDEGKSYILRFYLTDKAKAKLQGKRRKA
jgi:hypothetical protein